MFIPTINNLPAKFQRFLINPSHPLKAEIDAVFGQPLRPLKSNYIFDAGKWVLKLGRTDIDFTPDTHLYRVRKAEKIRTYIAKNNLGDHLAVPKKYLYWHPNELKFYVVAEKMNLSPEVVKPASVKEEDNFKRGAPHGGQMAALANNAPRRSLTPIQAKALAELSILGYTDLSYNNLYFTLDGKVAIIDTEPVKRTIKKALKKSTLYVLFGDRGALLTQQAIAGFAKLKLYTDTPEALKAVQKVERNHVLWRMATLITKLCVVLLALHYAPIATALIPIATVAKTVKISFTVFAYIKNISLALNVVNLYMLWMLSYKGLNGVLEIEKIESKGGA